MEDVLSNNMVSVPVEEYEYLKNCEVFVQTVIKTLFGDYRQYMEYDDSKNDSDGTAASEKS